MLFCFGISFADILRRFLTTCKKKVEHKYKEKWGKNNHAKKKGVFCSPLPFLNRPFYLGCPLRGTQELRSWRPSEAARTLSISLLSSFHLPWLLESLGPWASSGVSESCGLWWISKFSAWLSLGFVTVLGLEKRAPLGLNGWMADAPLVPRGWPWARSSQLCLHSAKDKRPTGSRSSRKSDDLDQPTFHQNSLPPENATKKFIFKPGPLPRLHQHGDMKRCALLLFTQHVRRPHL